MKQEKQLSIRSTEAAELAAALAERTGKPQKEVVLDALRLLEKDRSAAGARPRSSVHRLSWERFQLSLQRLQEELQEIQERTGEKVTSDHSWMYDELGLPR